MADSRDALTPGDRVLLVRTVRTTANVVYVDAISPLAEVRHIFERPAPDAEAFPAAPLLALIDAARECAQHAPTCRRVLRVVPQPGPCTCSAGPLRAALNDPTIKALVRALRPTTATAHATTTTEDAP